MGCGTSKFELDKDHHHSFKHRHLKHSNEKDKINIVTRSNDIDCNKEEDSKNGSQQGNDKKIGSQKLEEKANVAEEDESHDSDERLLAFYPSSPSFRVYCDDQNGSSQTDSTHEKKEEETPKGTKVPLTETEPQRRARRRRLSNVFHKGRTNGMKNILTAGNTPYKAFSFGLSEK